jgi:hypothetical protein
MNSEGYPSAPVSTPDGAAGDGAVEVTVAGGDAVGDAFGLAVAGGVATGAVAIAAGGAV